MRVLQATGLPFTFMHGEAGWDCFQRHGSSLPDETLAAARTAEAILFGASSRGNIESTVSLIREYDAKRGLPN